MPCPTKTIEKSICLGFRRAESVRAGSYHELESLHGKDGARLAAESHTAAIDEIERIVAEIDIKCNFLRLDGYLFAAEEDDAEMLSRELQAARRAGLRVEHVEHVPADFHDFGPALRFPDQAQFHPIKYISGLSRVLRDRGVRIYTGAHVMEVAENHSVRVQTERGSKVLAPGSSVEKIPGRRCTNPPASRCGRSRRLHASSNGMIQKRPGIVPVTVRGSTKPTGTY